MGMILASWFVPVLSADLGWNNGLKLTGVWGMSSSVLCFMLVKDRSTESGPLILRELPLDRRAFWGLSLMQFIRLGSYYTFIAWMPLVLREDYGFSIIATSAAISLLNVAGIFANPIGGWVSDRLDERRVLSGGFILLAVLIFTLPLQPVGVLLYFLVFLHEVHQDRCDQGERRQRHPPHLIASRVVPDITQQERQREGPKAGEGVVDPRYASSRVRAKEPWDDGERRAPGEVEEPAKKEN